LIGEEYVENAGRKIVTDADDFRTGKILFSELSVTSGSSVAFLSLWTAIAPSPIRHC
jgi:hypothetical protein